MTLAARQAGETVWRLVYRSEEASSCNPEWRPLAWSDEALIAEDGLLDGGGWEVEVLLALYALDSAQSADGWQQQPMDASQQLQGLWQRQPGEQQVQNSDGAGAAMAHAIRPLLPAAADRPAFYLPAVEFSTAAAGGAAPQAAGGQGDLVACTAAVPPQPGTGGSPTSCGSESLHGPAQELQRPGGSASPAIEQEGRGEAECGAELSGPDAQTSRPQPGRQLAQQPQQNGMNGGATPIVLATAEPGPATGSLTPAAAPESAAVQAEAAHQFGPAEAAAAGHPGWLAAVAAALAGTGCCPGRLVAAWQLGSLEELFSAGGDLAALRRPLLPNTLVLQFGDGQYLCPPPLPALQVQASGSALHRALHSAAGIGSAAMQGEEAVAAAPASPPRRGFASLLVSKLLRSTPNLQEAGSLHGPAAPQLAAEGGLSDADSDASSDATAATTLPRWTAGTTAANELAAKGAGNRGGSSAAGVAAALGGGPGAVGPRMLTLAGVQQCVTSLAALQGRVRDLAGRSQTLQAALAARLEPRRRGQQQSAALAALAGEAAHCRRQAAEVRQQLAEVQAATAAAARQATVRAQALVTTLKVMQASERRVGEAEASLRGEAGRGALVAVLRELVAQRCQMVCQLGAAFQLGPTQVSIPEAPPGGFLEDRLEQQWAGASVPDQPLTLIATFSRQLSGSGGMPGFAGGAAAVDSPSKYRQEMRLSIGGLEIRPRVWRKAFEEDGGYDIDAAEDRAAGVALGYVAQAVDRLGRYLGVALRYPLVLRGSRSAVVDCQPPVGAWAEAEGGKGGDRTRRPFLAPLGPGASSTAGAAGEQGVEYPLFCDSNRERARFAVGVFLLNKDVIQLLQAHGVSAAGPNHLLQNLHKLLLAAQSALPHLPPVLGASSALPR